MTLSNIFRGLVVVVLVMSFLALPTPVAAALATVTLDPSSQGASNQLLRVPLGLPSANWEVCADNDTSTLVSSLGNDWRNDLYNLSDVSLTGTIKSVTVHIQARATYIPSQTGARTIIRTNTSDYFGTPIELTTSWDQYSTTYTTNPNTSAPWTWDQINSLQAGVSLRRSRPVLPDPSLTTKVWVTVDYCIPPQVEAGGDQQVCQYGNSIPLTGENPGGGFWSGPGVSGSNFDPDDLTPGDYSVMYTYTDPDGCSNSDNKTVTINALPIVDAGDEQQVCQDSDPIDLTGENPLGGSWSGPGVSGSQFDPTGLDPGAYSVMYSYTDTDTGCSNSDNKTVTVNPLPDCTITAPSAVCADSTGNSASVPDAGDTATYDWSITNGTITSDTPYSNSITWDAGSTSPITISITITETDTGCTSDNSTAVTVNPRPTATASSNSPVCIGGTIQLTGGPSGMTTYSWTGPNGFSNNQKSPSIPNATAAMAGTYTLIVTDDNGCTSDNTTVSVSIIACGGGGSGGGIPASVLAAMAPAATAVACPLTLTVNMLGEITTAKMTSEGVLCENCLAFDPPKQNSWEAKAGTKLTLEGNKVPELIKVTTVGSSPPSGTAETIGPTYEINAYASLTGLTPSPITISPLSTMSSAYDPNELPKNTSEVLLAYYPNPDQGWLVMAPEGAVAEVGQARGTLNYFVPDTLLTKLAKPAAKFEVSNLKINPTQTQPTQQVTISVNVTNTGGTNGDYTVDLKVGGVVESAKQITLNAGASQTVSFATAKYAVGKYQIEIAGLTGEFVVSRPFNFNWWLIEGVIAAIILALGIWILVKWRRFSGY